MPSWSRNSLTARIRDHNHKIRYEGGSPNAKEICAYKSYLDPTADYGIVLGMTPELRCLALHHCRNLISIDASMDAINLYRNWTNLNSNNTELIIHANWFDLAKVIQNKVNFILGDGIFGNVVPYEHYSILLQFIYEQLLPDGVFITRQCLLPKDIKAHRDLLIDKFRRNKIDDSEFGLSMRIIGYLDLAYDPKSRILRNSDVYKNLKLDLDAGLISHHEYNLVNRFYFNGDNVIPSYQDWEDCLSQTGFIFEKTILVGKEWYEWYVVYSCRKI